MCKCWQWHIVVLMIALCVFFDRVNHELKILRRDLTRLFSRSSFCKMLRRIYVTEFFWRTNKWRRLRSWVNSSSVSTFLVSGVIAAFYRCIQHFFLLLKLCVYVYFHDSVVPSVSFRPVYTGRDTVGLLLTKTTNHIQGISLWSKTLFQALCLAGAPLHFFLQADYSNNPFYYFLFPFSVLWREKSLPHHQLKLSSCTFVSVTDMETMTKTPKTKKLPGVYPLYKELEQQDTVWDAFLLDLFLFF